MSIKENLLDRQRRCLAQGWPGTNSKRQSQYPANVPSHLTSADGCYVYDYDGRRYIDFVGGLGVTVLGYNHPKVNEAVIKQLNSGLVSGSLPSILELEVAELIQEMVPCAERVRFLKTGSESAAASVRVARAYTRNDWVWSNGYHGWHDEFTYLTKPAIGVPKVQYCIQKWEPSNAYKAGTWITEPVGLDINEEDKEQLERDCSEKDFVIFDEIVTGLRVPKYTVASMWELKPDIICLGKSIANGFPLAVCAGKASVMDCGEYFISSTYSGEAISLAAAKATLTEIRKKSMKDLYFYANRFQEKLNELLKPLDIKIEGYGTRGMYPITTELGALLAQEAANCGILLGKAYFYHWGHLEAEIDEYVLNVLGDAVRRIERGEVKLQGGRPMETFKR